MTAASPPSAMPDDAEFARREQLPSPLAEENEGRVGNGAQGGGVVGACERHRKAARLFQPREVCFRLPCARRAVTFIYPVRGALYHGGANFFKFRRRKGAPAGAQHGMALLLGERGARREPEIVELRRVHSSISPRR